MVKVTISDKDENLKPEMSARVTFLAVSRATGSAPTATGPMVLVPQEAVSTREGRTQVFEVVDNRVKARPVRVGKSDRDKVVILEGLEGGEQLVIDPPPALRDGDVVRVKNGGA
jgi:multidrug efflux pump subunit AcrA (membrane-fusion protein)